VIVSLAPHVHGTLAPATVPDSEVIEIVVPAHRDAWKARTADALAS